LYRFADQGKSAHVRHSIVPRRIRTSCHRFSKRRGSSVLHDHAHHVPVFEDSGNAFDDIPAQIEPA
jgi:hypothetical protein